jgi:hypothetical protein
VVGRQPEGGVARSRKGEIGEGRESWQVGWPMEWALPISERRRERERALAGGSEWRAGPVSNGFKNNPNLVQTRPNLI